MSDNYYDSGALNELGNKNGSGTSWYLCFWASSKFYKGDKVPNKHKECSGIRINMLVDILIKIW